MTKNVKIENVVESPVAPQFFINKENKELPVENTHLLSVRRPSLPIILVPGIMASRLGDTRTRGVVWDPDGGLKTLNRFRGLSPQERYQTLAAVKELLVPMNFDADFASEHCKDNFSTKYPHGESRGWGGVFWGGYGKLLKALDDWNTPLKLLVDLPVYAFGYNWMLDNFDTGKQLRVAIDQVKAWHDAKHVFLVTHSMGGLVARAACKLHGAEESVYGVVHGTQPVLGAPDAYRRMIAGEMGDGFMASIMADVIGPDGPCITAVLAHTVAGLELLPFRHYSLSPTCVSDKSEGEAGLKQWLHLITVHDKGNIVKEHYPKNGDPFSEIYYKGVRQSATSPDMPTSEKVYWRLLREEWVQPTKLNHETGREEVDAKAVETIRSNLELAEEFHEILDKDFPYCHPRTVQLYSADRQNDKKRVDSDNLTFCEIVWETREKTKRVKELCRKVDKDCDYVESLEFPIQEFLAQSNRKGGFQQLILLRKGEELTDTTPEYAGMVTRNLFRLGGDIYETQKNGGRIFVRRLLGRKEKIVGYPRCENGDTTVPEYSGQGLSPTLDAWPEDCRFHLASPSTGKKQATFRTNNTGHSDFFDENAILATKNALHNLILAWLAEHGGQAGEEFNCKLECLNSTPQKKRKEMNNASRNASGR